MTHVHFFYFQQLDFLINTRCIPRQTAVAAHHAVAGNNDADGVMSHRTPYGLCRHGLESALACDFLGNVTVCHGAAVWNAKQYFPNRFSEPGTFHLQGRQKVGLAAVEIKVEPLSGLFENGKILFLAIAMQRGGMVFLRVEPQTDEVFPVAVKREVSKGRWVMRKIGHGLKVK